MLTDNEPAGEVACTKETMSRRSGREKKQKARRYLPGFRCRAIMMFQEGGHRLAEVTQQLGNLVDVCPTNSLA